MKALIAGSTGKVGKAWLRMGASFDEMQWVALGGTAQFDLGTAGGIESILAQITQEKPQLLVLAAAMTHVDLCEQQPDQAHRVNVESVGRIAALCALMNTGLVFYSSDHVFGGSGPRSEEDDPAPLNVYGRSKVAAERAIQVAGGDYLIVRINVPLASSKDGESFYSFVAQKLLADEPVNIVTDQWNNPLDTARVAQWSFEAWQSGMRGVLHLGGGTYLTRFDCARLIADHLNKDHALIRPVTSAELNQVAPRPHRGGLLIARQAGLFGTAPDLPTILESL